MPERTPEGVQGFLSRRGFVRVASAGAVASILPRCTSEQGALGLQPEAKRVTPFVTSNEDFYLVAVDPSYRPPLDRQNVDANWSLELAGISGNSSRIGYDDLLGRADRSVHYTFECIGNRVGGQLIGNAEWRVVPLKEILARAPGGLAGVRSVMFEGLDDFYSSVSIERCTDDYAFVAMQMNGVPLPAGHGFPTRVILPDLYGMKQPRWLRRITLQEDAETTSYWEERGWAGEVPVKITSRLDPREDLAPDQPAELTGIAFAGARGIRKVEVSLDDGESWVACELVTGEQPHVWSLWRYLWQKPTPGRHTLMVRATDGTGALQTAERTDPSPDGASGYDRREVEIVATGHGTG